MGALDKSRLYGFVVLAKGIRPGPAHPPGVRSLLLEDGPIQVPPRAHFYVQVTRNLRSDVILERQG